MKRRKFFITLAILSFFPILYSKQDNQNLRVINGWVLKSQDLQ